MDRTQAPGPTGRATSGATTSTDSSLYTSGFELADLTSHHSSHRANANTPAPGTAAYPPPQSDTHSAQTLLFDGGPRSPQQKLKYVAHIGFAQALLEEKPKKWTRTMYKVYFFMGVAFLNSVICGYNASLIGGIRVMDHFENYFGVKTTGSKAGILLSSYVLGNICGSFFGGPIADVLGRRWGMFTSAIVNILATCVQGSATNLGVYITGRFILGFGVAIGVTAGPCYVVEMAHPAWRSQLTGFYNMFWLVGSTPGSFATFASAKIDSTWSWRLPTWFQAMVPILLMISCLFIPESPRWLYSNGRTEEAVRVLEKYHGEGNRKSPIVLLTYKELVEEVYIRGMDKRWWDYSSLFNTKEAWWRNACVLGMAFFSQLAGNGALTYFMPSLVQTIGITDKQTQLFFNAIDNLLSFIIAPIGALLVERLGRRRVLLTGNSLFVLWWTIITVLMALYANKPPGEGNIHGARATIAFINIFISTYSFTYTPLQALYPVECLSYENRAKGMGMYTLGANLASLFNTYVIPVVLERVGWKFYFTYVGWNVVQVVFIYFFFVETKGRTLEEINEIFKAPYPKARSLATHAVLVDEDRGILYQAMQDQDELWSTGDTGETS